MRHDVYDVDNYGAPPPPYRGQSLPLGEVVVIRDYWLNVTDTRFRNTRHLPTLIDWRYADDPVTPHHSLSASENVRDVLIDLRRNHRLPACGVFCQEDIPDKDAVCIYFVGETIYLRGKIEGRWS